MGGVLQGIRVLDFGRYIAGPYCGCILADLGAEVIRIEKVDGSEDRFTTPVGTDDEGMVGAGFLHLNRNKLGIALDPMKPEGRELVKRLVETADVVIANLPIDSLRSMGLDYDSLKAIKPDIILAMSSTYGETGPYATRIGFDGIAQAMCGNMYLSGRPSEPMKSWVPWTDFGTALSTTVAIMAALMHRDRTGRGQYVESSLLSTALSCNNASLIEEAVLKSGRVGTGNRGQTSAPADVFQCKDGFILVRVVGTPMFKRWARLMGDECWLTDPSYRSDIDRGNNSLTISRRMQSWCEDKSIEEAVQILESARIPCAKIYSPKDVLEDPHVIDGGFFNAHEYPGVAREYPVMARLFRMSDCEVGSRRRAPLLGEHTREILADVGLREEEIDKLKRERVVYFSDKAR
jgi:crotonobetainyl-CoA:carnitine CoA-transferase CaiB-like acyl-CoA transferase